jgi:hypothetical protein
MSSCFPLLLWAVNCWAIAWSRRVDPPGRARRNNLDCDIYCHVGSLIAYQVYLAAAYVGEALACVKDVRSTGGVGGLIDCQFSRYNRDQTGTRVRVPASVISGLESVPSDIEI